MSGKVRVSQNSISDISSVTAETKDHQHVITTNVIKTDNNSDSSSKIGYFIGVGYVLCAGLALQFQSCWVKFAKIEGFEAFEVLLIRGIIQIFCTGMIDVYDNYLCTKDENPETNIPTHHYKPRNLGPQNQTDWMYVCIRGILGFFTAYTNYCGLGLLPLGDSVTIFATFPIWTIIFAAIFLKERIRFYHFIALILGIFGISLIAQPSFLFPGKIKAVADPSYATGVAYCLFGSFVNSGAFLVLRKLKHIKATYSVYAYGVGAIVGSLVIGATNVNDWKSIDLSTWYQPALLFSLGVFGFSGQYLKTKSIQYIPAGIASLVRSTDVLFGYTLQNIFFPTDKLDCYKVIGAICVVLPIIIIALGKLQKSNNQQKLQNV